MYTFKQTKKMNLLIAEFSYLYLTLLLTHYLKTVVS